MTAMTRNLHVHQTCGRDLRTRKLLYCTLSANKTRIFFLVLFFAEYLKRPDSRSSVGAHAHAHVHTYTLVVVLLLFFCYHRLVFSKFIQVNAAASVSPDYFFPECIWIPNWRYRARVGGLGMVASNTSNVNKSSGDKSNLGQNETREERIKGSEARSSWKRNRFVEKGEAGCSLGGVRRKAEPYRV